MNDSPEHDEWVDEVMAELDRRSGPSVRRGDTLVMVLILLSTLIMFALTVIGAITVIGWLT